MISVHAEMPKCCSTNTRPVDGNDGNEPAMHRCPFPLRTLEQSTFAERVRGHAKKKWTKKVELLFSATLEYKTKKRYANGAIGRILRL